MQVIDKRQVRIDDLRRTLQKQTIPIEVCMRTQCTCTILPGRFATHATKIPAAVTMYALTPKAP
jgi:hypothetical protein